MFIRELTLLSLWFLRKINLLDAIEPSESTIKTPTIHNQLRIEAIFKLYSL
jgi:hypothetical protein